MGKALFAIAATATFASASLISGPAKAVVLGSPLGLGAAAGALDPIESVRYCEFYDAEVGDYVVFWVPGPCLRLGAPGYDIWLGRYYRGHQHWRGRLSSRPWTHGGGGGMRQGGVRQGGTTYRSDGVGRRGGSAVQGGGGYRGSAGGGQRVYRSGGGGGGGSARIQGGGGGGMRGAVGRGGGQAGGGGQRGGGGGSARSGGSSHGAQGPAR